MNENNKNSQLTEKIKPFVENYLDNEYPEGFDEMPDKYEIDEITQQVKTQLLSEHPDLSQELETNAGDVQIAFFGCGCILAAIVAAAIIARCRRRRRFCDVNNNGTNSVLGENTRRCNCGRNSVLGENIRRCNCDRNSQLGTGFGRNFPSNTGFRRDKHGREFPSDIGSRRDDHRRECRRGRDFGRCRRGRKCPCGVDFNKNLFFIDFKRLRFDNIFNFGKCHKRCRCGRNCPCDRGFERGRHDRRFPYDRDYDRKFPYDRDFDRHRCGRDFSYDKGSKRFCHLRTVLKNS